MSELLAGVWSAHGSPVCWDPPGDANSPESRAASGAEAPGSRCELRRHRLCSLNEDTSARPREQGSSRPGAPASPAARDGALCTDAAARLSAQPGHRPVVTHFVQSLEPAASPLALGHTSCQDRLCCHHPEGGTCWQHSNGKGPRAVLGTFLCPHPRTTGWMGSQSLVPLEGYSGIQVQDYGSGFLGKDPELFQTLA